MTLGVLHHDKSIRHSRVYSKRNNPGMYNMDNKIRDIQLKKDG